MAYVYWLPSQNRKRSNANPFNEKLANALLTSTGGGNRARHYSGALHPALESYFHMSERDLDHAAKAQLFWKRVFEYSFDEINTLHE